MEFKSLNANDINNYYYLYYFRNGKLRFPMIGH